MIFPDVDNLSTSTDTKHYAQHRSESLGGGKEVQPRRDRQVVGADLATTAGEL